MSLPLQCLLRLPPCLRTQAFQQTLPQGYGSLGLDRRLGRAFTNTRRTLKQQRPIRKPVTPPPRRPQQTRVNPAVLSREPTPATRSPLSYAETLLQYGDNILLYKAPNHRSFYITSYLMGGLLLFGAYNWAIVVSIPSPGKDDKGSWGRSVMNGVTMGTTLIVAIFGTVLFLAPARLIRTISLRAVPTLDGAGTGAARRAMLSCQMENSLPFMRTRSIDVPPAETFLDRNVSAVDIDLTSIPLGQAQAFTAHAHTAAARPAAQSQNSISRAWTTVARDIRRMCYREGIAYVRFEQHGNWKVDLQHCELLDNGRPLDRLTTPDMSRGVGPVAWIKRRMMA